MTEKKKFTYSALVMLIVLIAAYSNHFFNEFHFDDFHTIVNNVHVRKLSNIPKFFVDPTLFSASVDHQSLRPLVSTTLAIDYWLGGEMKPFFFQLSNFLWHIGLCVLLFFVYLKIISIFSKSKWNPYIALFGAAWFAVHTAGAETINYIISRSDILSTFFIVLAFYVYVAYPQKRKLHYYILPAILGIFAKETVPVLVILLFFYILLFEKNLSLPQLFKKSGLKAMGGVVVQLLPLLIAIILVQLYTLSSLIGGSSVSFGMSNPAGYYWITQTYVWLLYFKSFFLPIHLSADTDMKVITDIWDTKIIMGVLFLVLLIITVFKTSVKPQNRPIAFGLIWFAASLLPTSLAPFAEVMNDHRMYFAFTGLTLSVITAIGNWMNNHEKVLETSKIRRMALLSTLSLIIMLNAYGAFQRNKVWRTEESLWYDVTQKSPDNGRGLMNYGLSQMEKGHYEKALEYFLKAQPLVPAYSSLYVNLGIVLGRLNRHTEAETNFHTAISLSPNYSEAYYLYARYLLENGRISDAKANAEKALAINPNHIEALNILMSCLQSLRQWDALEKTAKHKLDLMPGDAQAQTFLAASASKIAADSTRTAVPQPKTADDFLNYSLLMYQMGNFNECIKACEEVLKLKPNSADAYSNMCAAYNSMQQWEKGLEACKKALQIDPGHKLAQGNLQWSLRKQN